jgi:hypothetical protein
MIVAAAFCPHPPLLVPELAQGAAAELDDLRAACRAAIRRVVTPGVRPLVIGAGERWQFHDANARGSLAGYGLDLTVPLGTDAPGLVELPLSLTIGAWLLRDAIGPECGAIGWSIGPDGDGDHGLLDADDAPSALIVMGDGSARRSTTAPGYLDDRAAGFDAQVARALGGGEGYRLNAGVLDEELAAELLVAGLPAWDAAAFELEPVEWSAELLYDAAPYGVGYFVAAWTPK